MDNIRKFFVFCTVGLIAFIIDISFFNLFLFFDIDFVFSRGFAILISMIFNFNSNRIITFSARKGFISNQLLKYLTVYGVAFFTNLLTGLIIITLFGETWLVSNIAAIMGIGVAIPITFFGLLLWAFN